MQTNRTFSEQMQQLSDEVLSNTNCSNNFNTGEVDTAKLLLEVAEVHNLHHDIEALEKENLELKEKLNIATIYIQELENKTKHNSRNAGRHKLNTTQKFSDFCSLMQEKKDKRGNNAFLAHLKKNILLLFKRIQLKKIATISYLLFSY